MPRKKIPQKFTSDGIIAHFNLRRRNHQHKLYRETQDFLQAVYDQLTKKIPKRKELIMELNISLRRTRYRIVERSTRKVIKDVDRGGYETEKKAVGAIKRYIKKNKGFTFTPTATKKVVAKKKTTKLREAVA